VVLTAHGEKKIRVIKVIRDSSPGLGLKEAKDLVDRPPSMIATGVSEHAAGLLASELQAAGATAAVQLPEPIAAAEIETPRDGVAGDLERLAALHEKGALTDEEFSDAKRRVLQSSSA
jgi:hypothetical protein